MFKIREIHTDKAKVKLELEGGKQLVGYILKMDIKNDIMEFLQDGSIEAISFPLKDLIRAEEIQERLQ